MRILIAILVALAACGVADPEQPVAWTVGMRPVAAAGSSPEWSARVDAARTEWIDLLGCSVAFDGSAGTQPVELVTAEQMITDTGSSLVIGYTFHDRILVEGTADDLARYPTYAHRTLLHEMGHALGLAHVAATADADSIMHSGDDDVSDPDDNDIANARAAIGCAP